MFDNLLPAEQKLLEACQKEETLSLSKKRPSKKTTSNEITGMFLRQLILSNNREININGNKSILQIGPKGINFSGAYISGTFDFSYCKTDVPFGFISSIFENKINLSDSKIRFLNLHGSSIHSMNAQGLICECDVFLRDGFQAKGIVDFVSAKIAGGLDCSKGKFTNKNGYALNCNSAKIQGNVFLNSGFESQGEVNFASAQITGGLDCSKGKFINENKSALICSHLKIQENVFLNDGFESIGKVNFGSAQLGGSLICSKGQFSNENGDALNCDKVKIQGSVFLNNGFESKGKVNFVSAQIESNLLCSKGKFTNENGDALSCNSAKIQGNVFFAKGFFVTGSLVFTASKIGKISISSTIIIRGNCLFSSVKVDTISITKINYNEDRLKKNGFGKLTLDGLEYNHLLGENLDSLTFKKWLKKMPEFMPQPYKQLAKVLRNMGHNRDADEIMIEYNNIITEKSDNKFITILRQIYGKTAGYGYKPMRVLKTMAMIWVFCGTFFLGVSKVAVFAPSDPLVFQKKETYACNVNANGTPILSIFNWSDYNSTNNWVANTNLDGEYSTFSPYWYSLDILLPIVDLQMDKDWGQFVPSDGVTLNHVTRWIVWIEILAGWIFSLILVAILSGLAKNEKD